MALPAAAQWSQDDFHVQRWALAEGLPGNHVSAIVQDQDGFLWLATMAGLVRFDGTSFQVFNETVQGMPSSRITALDSGLSGRLWIGTELGHVAVRENGIFRTVAEPGFPGHPVTSIAEDRNGRVWFVHTDNWRWGTENWLWRWDGKTTRVASGIQALLSDHPPPRDLIPTEIPGGFAMQQPVLSRGEDMRVWLRTRGGSGIRLDPPGGEMFESGDSSVHMLGSPPLFANVVQDSIELVEPGGSRTARLPRKPMRLRAVWLRDRHGRVWVSTTDGLEVHGPERTAPLATWRLDSRVLDLIEDREGNIWVATRMHGILRIQTAAVRQLGPAQGIPLPAKLRAEPDGSAVMSVQVLQPDPDLADPRLVYRLTPGARRPVGETAHWVRVDSQGRRWQFGSRGLVRILPDGSRQHLERLIDVLHEDPFDPDVFWSQDISTVFRIQVFEDRDPEVLDEWAIVARSAPFFDPGGGLWIGGANGLHRIDGDRHVVFDRADGLPVNEVRALHPDGDGGLWIGTYGGGLVHYDGRAFRVIEQRHGLVENFVSAIVADDFGALWMSGNRGIQRVRVGDLEAFLDGAIASVPATLFGERHGLDNPEAIGPYSGVRVGTWLYFSTFGGLATIDPAVVAAREEFKPQVHLLNASGSRRLGEHSTLEVRPDQHGFELQASAIHLSAPETLRYRHRLIGQDPGWIDNGPDRRVSYTGLTPGDYRLELQARHSGGPWMDATATPQIKVLPLWWETAWARTAAGLAFFGLLIVAWRVANRRTRNRSRVLEAVVAERTRDLQRERDTVADQAARLRELADGRARFIAGISHELRTPLTLIRGPLDALAETREKNADRRSDGMVQQARDNVDRLQALIDRLLESARLEGGAVSLSVREMDLSDWLMDLAQRLRPLFDERGSRLVSKIPDKKMPVWIDPVLMDSAITNLLVNALRHGPGGGTVTLSVHRDADGRIAIDVIDDGPGIAPEHRDHVFERFYRARGEQSRGNYGLGLWLVRQIIERHHGTVDLLDNHGGAHFRVRIAAGPNHFEEAEIGDTSDQSPDPPDTLRYGGQAEAAEPSASVKDAPTVLVVDDHAGIRALVRDALGGDWHVKEAADGQAALDAVRMRLPDVIVSDIMMPRIDGIELLSALRGDPETDFLPIVMLTAKSEIDDRIAGLEHGADAYLAKPFDRRELRAVVDGLLKQRKRLHEHLVTPTGAAADEADPNRPAWAPEDLNEQQRVFLNRFQAAVEARIADENLAIDDLAEALGQSRATLYRKLKQAVGRSPSELIREIRLQKARALVEQGTGSISEVGYAVGFKSVAHFSNTFLTRYGIRPSRLRE